MNGAVISYGGERSSGMMSGPYSGQVTDKSRVHDEMIKNWETVLGEVKMPQMQSTWSIEKKIRTLWDTNLGETLRGHMWVLYNANQERGWALRIFPIIGRDALEEARVILDGNRVRTVEYEFKAGIAPTVSPKAPSRLVNFTKKTTERSMSANGLAVEFPPDIFTTREGAQTMMNSLAQIGRSFANTWNVATSHDLLSEAMEVSDQELRDRIGFPTTLDQWEKLWRERFQQMFVLNKEGERLGVIQRAVEKAAQNRGVSTIDVMVLPSQASTLLNAQGPVTRQALLPDGVYSSSQGMLVQPPDKIIGYTTKGAAVWESNPILTFDGIPIDPFEHGVEVGQYFTSSGNSQMTKREGLAYMSRDRGCTIWDFHMRATHTIGIMDQIDNSNIFDESGRLTGPGAKVLSEIMLYDVKRNVKRNPTSLDWWYPKPGASAKRAKRQGDGISRPGFGGSGGGGDDDDSFGGGGGGGDGDFGDADLTVENILNTDYSPTDVLGFVPHLNFYNLIKAAGDGVADVIGAQLARLSSEDFAELKTAGQADRESEAFAGRVIQPSIFEDDVMGIDSKSSDPSVPESFNQICPHVVWDVLPELNNSLTISQIEEPDPPYYIAFPLESKDDSPFFPFPVLSDSESFTLQSRFIYVPQAGHEHAYAQYVASLYEVASTFTRTFLNMKKEQNLGPITDRVVTYVNNTSKGLSRALWFKAGAVSEENIKQIIFHDAIMMLLYLFYRGAGEDLSQEQQTKIETIFANLNRAIVTSTNYLFQQLTHMAVNDQIIAYFLKADQERINLGPATLEQRNLLMQYSSKLRDRFSTGAATGAKTIEERLGVDIYKWVRTYQRQLEERKAQVDQFIADTETKRTVTRFCREFQGLILDQNWASSDIRAIRQFVFQLIVNTRQVLAGLPQSLQTFATSAADRLALHAISSKDRYNTPSDEQDERRESGRKRRRDGDGGGDDPGDSDRSEYRSAKSALEDTKQMFLTRPLFLCLVKFNVCIPIGFLLTRPWIQLRTGSMLALCAAGTAKVAIVDPAISIGTSVSENTMLMQWTAKSGTLIPIPKNLFFVPSVQSKGYMRGGDCTFFRFSKSDVDSIRTCNPTASMFCFAVPYGFAPVSQLIDLCGRHSPEGVRFNEEKGLHFPTAKIYQETFGYDQGRGNPIELRNFINPSTRCSNTTLGQGTHFLVSNDGKGGISTIMRGGKDAFGPMLNVASCEAINEGGGNQPMFPGITHVQNQLGPDISHQTIAKIPTMH
jgi:hypothetical protein